MAREVERAKHLVKVEIARAIREGVAKGLKGSNNQMVAFLRGMEVGAKGDMTRVNRAIAADMREAVATAYEERVNAVREVGPYTRPGRRSGFLGKVIQRADLARGDADGIAFINEQAMDKEAAHWRRLNFGAGAIAGTQPSPVPLRLFGETVGTVSLPYSASPAFSLPKGFFIQGNTARIPQAGYKGGGTKGTFAPSQRSPYRPALTVGIRGRHFLEAGLDEMVKQIPVRYSDLMNEWIQAGGRKARAVTSAI